MTWRAIFICPKVRREGRAQRAAASSVAGPARLWSPRHRMRLCSNVRFLKPAPRNQIHAVGAALAERMGLTSISDVTTEGKEGVNSINKG